MSQQKTMGKSIRIIVIIAVVFLGGILTNSIYTRHTNNNFNRTPTSIQTPSRIQTNSQCTQGQTDLEGQCYTTTEPVGYGVDSLTCPVGYFMMGSGFTNANCLLFAGQPLPSISTREYTPLQVIQHLDQLDHQHIAIRGNLEWTGSNGVGFDCQDANLVTSFKYFTPVLNPFNSSIPDQDVNAIVTSFKYYTQVLNPYTTAIADQNAYSFEIETLTPNHQKITVAYPYNNLETGGKIGFTLDNDVTIHGIVEKKTIPICGIPVTGAIFLVDKSDLSQFH